MTHDHPAIRLGGDPAYMAPAGGAGMMPPSSQFAGEKLEAISSFRDFCLGKAIPAYPMEIFLEVSNVCDLKCTMCSDFSGHNPHRGAAIHAKKRGFIDTGMILDRFEPLLRHALSVHCFGGGEPTIHPDFRRIIERVSGYEVLIDFFTNGMHFDSGLAEFLVEGGIHKVVISFSGLTRDVYEGFYLGGRYDKVLAGVRRIAELKRAGGTPYPIIEINSLGFRQHVAAFDSFVEMMAGHGANVVHLKQLQRWPHISHIDPHVSIMRPWVEGEIIARAEAIGRRLGVQVSADQYLRMGVGSEDEYRRRIAEMAENQGTPAARPSGQPPVRALKLNEDKTVVQALFRTEASPRPDFHCMEPFKTLFVTRNGSIRPCCFHNHGSWHLGDATRSDPLEIWRGVGFQVMRDAILAGRYPLELCGPCLAKRLGPEEHFVHDQVRAYLAWHQSRFGPGLRDALARQAPNAVNDMASTRGRQIVARVRRSAGPVPADADRADVLTGLPASPMLDQTIAAVIEGNLEQVGEEIVGWVWSPIRSHARLPVSVWYDEQRIAHGVADVMRADLAEAGKGDGAHGFHLVLPLAKEKGRQVVVTVGDDPGQLQFRPPAPTVIDIAEYFRHQRLSPSDLEQIIADIGSPRICVSLVTGRCGSTYLSEIVSLYGRFGTGSEPLNPFLVSTDDAPARELSPFLRRRLFERNLAGGIVYFQMAPREFRRLLRLLPDSFVETATVSSIRRRNIISQAISFAVATSSGLWHNYGLEELEHGPELNDDFIELAKSHVDNILESEVLIEEFRSHYGTRFVGNIFYEDIVSSPLETISSMMMMHGHTPAIGDLSRTIASEAGTKKIRYRSFPSAYERVLERFPDLWDLLRKRLGDESCIGDHPPE